MDNRLLFGGYRVHGNNEVLVRRRLQPNSLTNGPEFRQGAYGRVQCEAIVKAHLIALMRDGRCAGEFGQMDQARRLQPNG